LGHDELLVFWEVGTGSTKRVLGPGGLPRPMKTALAMRTNRRAQSASRRHWPSEIELKRQIARHTKKTRRIGDQQRGKAVGVVGLLGGRLRVQFHCKEGAGANHIICKREL